MFGMMLASMPNPAKTSTRNRDGTMLQPTDAIVLRATRERRRWSGASPLR